jgi:hypothetical protein
MKSTGKISWIIAIILINFAFIVSSCDKTDAATDIPGDEKTSSSVYIDSINCNCILNPADTIYEHEIAMLEHMREEEKLARDVYLAMYDRYAIPIFKNISKSEQHHMNQVLCLLEYYNLPDPASPDTGIFNDPDLQALYNDLIALGTISLVDGLTVGATIEDLDIFDLEEHIGETSNEAIVRIFSSLSCASGNHLRSFTAWLENKGITYVPQYISQEDYDGIISLPHQFCGGQ